MSKKPPFIKMYIKDFAFDIQELSNEELGAYMRDLLKSYKTGKILEKNKEESLFLELEKSLSNYFAICERNKNNRINSMTSSDDSSTTRQPLDDALVNQEPLTINQEPLTNKKDKSASKYSLEKFNDFWSHYPKKTGKKKALEKYTSALKKHSHEKILTGVVVYKKYCEKENIEIKYIKSPEAWIFQECWNDEYKTSFSNKSKQSTQIIDKDESWTNQF